MTKLGSGILGIASVMAAASSPVAAQSFEEAARLLAERDTSGAIEVYEALVKANLKNAEAHYLAGLLYMSRHPAGTDLSPNRRKAEEHFRYATRFQGDSAKYWLALAELFRGEDNTFTRIQVNGLLEKALEAARRTGSEGTLAALEYRAARTSWERYEHYGHRYLMNDFGGTLNQTLFADDWRYVRQFFEERVRPDPGSPGERPLMTAEDHLWRVVERAPGHIDGAGLLLIALGEGNRWTEAWGVTRRLIRAVPDSGRAWALHGMSLARVGQWRAAGAAYDSAFARMTEEERTPYADLGQIMRAADRVRFYQMGGAEQAQLDTVYWRAAQPLTLTGTNELRTEFFARITYALHRWTDRLRGYEGTGTDVGVVFVRYGPPDVWAQFDRSDINWIYWRPQLRFSFSMTPGYARARFGGQSAEAYRVAQVTFPARFDNVPIVRTLDTVLVQVAQFRSDRNDTTDVAIFGFLPVGRIADSASVADLELATAAVIQDTLGNDVVRSQRSEILRGGTRDLQQQRTWRMQVAPAEYYVRVETHVPVLVRGARSTELVTVRRYGRRELELSDVLMTRRVAPRDSTFTRWTDFFIEPTAGRIEPGDPLGLLWEVYNLQPDSSGIAHYKVELRITVDAIERRGLFARVVGGLGDATGLSALGDDRVELAYDRDVAIEPAGVSVEYLSIDLRDAPQGEYGITVIITDLVSGRSASRDRTISVSSTPLGPKP